MLCISQLFIYPIKSLGGIAVNSAQVSPMGFVHDRRWMLVDLNNRFLTQREIPEMCMLQVALSEEGLRVFHKTGKGKELQISLIPEGTDEVQVQLFEDECKAVYVSQVADRWFEEMLSTPCKLVYIPEDSNRRVDNRYAPKGITTGFADGFPYLLIGQSSMNDLNGRLRQEVSVGRFRPNIVFEGGTPFLEDRIDYFVVNDVRFFAVKPCARCTIPTIDPLSGEKSEEPIRTLSTYRKMDHKIYFGQNLFAQGSGRIGVGDPLTILKFKEGASQPKPL